METTNGKYIFEIFPQEYIDLQKELSTDYHPKLQEVLAGIGYDDLDMKLAFIASYCEIMLDGDYDLDGRRQLCKILTERLILLRILPDAQKIILLQ